MPSTHRIRTTALIAWLLAAAVVWAAPEKHVRVIVDTSISMRGTRTQPANDPSGLALISTAMFYDLARYELGPDGTFKVRTFEAGSGGCPGSVPRSANSPWLTPGGVAERDKFIASLLEIRYDAPCTFFYPYLNAAAEDLAPARQGHDVKRVIVMVTDGLPETPSQDEERRLLQELAGRLQSSEIELYVLAFGQTAKQNEDFFRGIFRFNQPGGVAGDIFTDSTGTQIVETMVKIFEASFAYQAEVVTGDSLDLAKGAEQRHVAVLARYEPPKVPAFRITAPPTAAAGISVKGPVAAAMGHEVAGVQPAGSGKPISYGVQWIVGPAAGPHRFVESGRQPNQIAILRPRNLRVEVTAAPESPVDVAMVDSPMRLRVLVRPADGGPGDPGAVNIDYRVYAVRNAGAPGGYDYVPSEDWIPAVSGGGKFVPGEGREYEIQPVFEGSSAFNGDPKTGRPYFDGYIEVRAQIDGTTVAIMPGQHSVNVYPRLSLDPDPSRVQLTHGASGTLTGGQDGCAEFTFVSKVGDLRNSEYTLSASIDGDALKGGLSGATVFLNGVEIGGWAHGRRLSRTAILERPFKACIIVPRYSSGGEGLTLPIRFRLWQADNDPYRQLDAVRPLALLANIEAAGVIQRYSNLFSLGLLLLLMLLLWLLLTRLGLPRDFRVALADRPSLEHGATASPGDASPLQRLLRRHGRVPLHASGGDRVIGSIVPSGEDLYAFRPEKGFFELCESDDLGRLRLVQQQGDGDFELSVHRTYCVKGSDQSVHYFRCQYEPGALN
jgi:hypothetical protein